MNVALKSRSVAERMAVLAAKAHPVDMLDFATAIGCDPAGVPIDLVVFQSREAAMDSRVVQYSGSIIGKSADASIWIARLLTVADVTPTVVAIAAEAMRIAGLPHGLSLVDPATISHSFAVYDARFANDHLQIPGRNDALSDTQCVLLIDLQDPVGSWVACAAKLLSADSAWLLTALSEEAGGVIGAGRLAELFAKDIEEIYPVWCRWTGPLVLVVIEELPSVLSQAITSIGN